MFRYVSKDTRICQLLLEIDANGMGGGHAHKHILGTFEAVPRVALSQL